MASIDINKLIQESMSTTMGEEEPGEGAGSDVAENNATSVDENNNSLHETMKSVLESPDFKKVGALLRKDTPVGKSASGAAGKGTAGVEAGSGKVVSSAGKGTDGVEPGTGYGDGAVDRAVRGVKGAGKAVKDAVADNPKVAAGAGAGAAGLVGAGMLAKKYLNRKKK